ncbi:bifunctional diaminohydroxyphosphoribosylaminopyrimidine deaminase/5-amino-6-(5-phosphoribosylamino)uracil reductase RibD [Campylobacter sp. MIT 12-8780]|uniref:bifunctional diaminohydroxyphosphoribosylaminopyrimidine deaminase/5-amino-6-(5-phosphoribosylamino)uracil reductase RibD n=1 Tax=unclassified Campylobacter TaxID=2593542 RepID=UPI00115DCB36|nr:MULTISPECIES: bifunctional diaminohydroxyphosphoribosylaminopyrimidine deaminase/5-amino-6-(5-phosphoribosylamino)uracil reductase RibD [unclassified Campylobacter]NDJ27309.1 bifunctional diaminohydroxyphosphoribosylaminopyrimidine deaminase/5-amino-6-(5-phosphoribosylamino)uracil reductase RibD [Campylobacter sp. MIT 19-121]TQR40362.1 bifunctional diaminohydroxyphosphoribosylaminopyrimidine deaminase/5-amino-6-(5-phosphoribosylamino)uracil reductase RibD [Campylobacter sp. MIT 12-8780]
MTKEFYMKLALNEAWNFQFLTYPNPAVGCVILDKNGKLLSIRAHEQAGQAHAELNAIKTALKELDPALQIPDEANAAHEFILKNHHFLLKDASAFVTLEPCTHKGKTPACARLFSELKFKKVFISVKDTHKLASGGAEFLRQHGIEVELGLCEKEGLDLLKPFLKWQKNEPFKLFKLALSLNGSPFGKFVSNELSRSYAHKIRSKLDLLVVGGETLRKDRPVLDARLAGKEAKAPNLCILSHQELASFDEKIPALKVPNRQIFTQIPKEAKFMMFEGGAEFLKSFAKDMDMFLIFSNSKFTAQANASLNLELKPLYKGFLGDDTYGIYEL